MPLPGATRGVLLDVEGTTTPISFVHETLFPYARARLAGYAARASDDIAVAEALAALRAERESEKDPGVPEFGDGAGYTAYLMQHDRKSTGLKALQGIIWEEGYRSGELRAPVYADVPPAFETWNRAAVTIRIYSSGSVLAQRLLFGHTDHGDLTPLLDGYHDTTTGPKKDPASYHAIAAAFGLPASEVLFLSDSVGELDAAREASMQTGCLMRPDNPPTDAGRHARYRDFTALAASL